MNRFLIQIENALQPIYAPLPRLPRRLTDWLARHLWWIILVFAVITALLVVLLVPFIIVISIVTPDQFATYFAREGVTRESLLSDGIVSVTLGVISLTLMFMAVKPLQRMAHIGWSLLLLEQVISAVTSVIPIIQKFDGTSLTGFGLNLLFSAAVIYILFQVRPHFKNTGHQKNAR